MAVVVNPAPPKVRADRRPGQETERRRVIANDRAGRARRRQLRRLRRKRWMNNAIQLFATVGLGLGILFPVLAYGHTGSWTAGLQPASRYRSERRAAIVTAVPAAAVLSGSEARTATPEPVIPTATPTPLPTATPLPARLLQATAWQATLDQAAGHSHATQTQAAGQYAATQTALPPILTANALERAATSTAAASDQ